MYVCMYVCCMYVCMYVVCTYVQSLCERANCTRQFECDKYTYTRTYVVAQPHWQLWMLNQTCNHARAWKHEQRVTTYHFMENLVDTGRAKRLASHSLPRAHRFHGLVHPLHLSTVWVFTFSEDAPPCWHSLHTLQANSFHTQIILPPSPLSYWEPTVPYFPISYSVSKEKIAYGGKGWHSRLCPSLELDLSTPIKKVVKTI